MSVNLKKEKKFVVPEEFKGNFNDLYIYVPVVNRVVRIAEGTGDNLLGEDTENGYVDYIYLEAYDVEQNMPEADGGQLMTKELVQDKYSGLYETIPDVLDLLYDNKDLEFIFLHQD